MVPTEPPYCVICPKCHLTTSHTEDSCRHCGEPMPKPWGHGGILERTLSLIREVNPEVSDANLCTKCGNSDNLSSDQELCYHCGTFQWAKILGRA